MEERSGLEGLVALVTGASSGIGAATAKVFAREGVRVAATGRDEAALAKLVGEIVAGGGEARAFRGDASDPGQVEQVVAAAAQHFGQINILVNSAGVLQGGGVGSGACTVENWDFNFAVNARGTFCFLSECVPHLKAAAKGTASVVFVSSVNALQSFAGCASYCASKAAAEMLMRCASVDLAPHGIRVNSVNPGVVMTELQKRGGMGEEAYESFIQRSVQVTHPLGAALGRVAEPSDIAESILFLAAPTGACFITGTSLTVDGGRRNLGAR